MYSKELDQIIQISCAKGTKHDFKIFKESKVWEQEEIRNVEWLADCGYLGIDKMVPNSTIPTKKPKKSKKNSEPKLTKEEKKRNKEISQERVPVENIIRECKIFRITKDKNRGKHKNYSLCWNLVAGFVNLKRFIYRLSKFLIFLILAI